jgi:hypothetical protein
MSTTYNQNLLSSSNSDNSRDLFGSFLNAQTNRRLATEESTLIQMGFEQKLIQKVYTFLHPTSLNQAIDFMTEINGIYQHHFFFSTRSPSPSKCFICGKSPMNHIDHEAFNEFNGQSTLNNFNRQMKEVTSFNAIDDVDDDDNICILCDDQLTSNDVKKCNALLCGHKCCGTCWFEYLKHKIEESNVSKIHCFGINCDTVLNDDFIMETISNDKNLVEKYHRFKAKALIIDDPNKKFCPIPNCDGYIEKHPTMKYVQCRNGHKTCFTCLKKPHGNTECDNEIDKDFQLWKKNKVLKRCPKCTMYTEKNEGCNHMTCAQCKYQWCWLCEREYEPRHYYIGKCKNLQFAKANYLNEAKAAYEFVDIWERVEDDDAGCCAVCCGKIYQYFAGLDIFGDNYVFNFIAWTLLMVLFGVPVNEFEYLLSFLDTLPGSSCLTQVIVYACSLVIILSQFIAYQIWFSCIYIVFSLPICFYWPLVNKVIGWWIENVYMAAPEGRDD